MEARLCGAVVVLSAVAWACPGHVAYNVHVHVKLGVRQSQAECCSRAPRMTVMRDQMKACVARCAA